jgi:hypothetical protein
MHLGIELGMVINKHDPEDRKRVQVFIPHLSNTLFKDWNNSNDWKGIGEKELLSFKNPNELSGDILKRLKASLPWAEAAVGIFGGGTTMTANTINGNLNVSNSGGDTLTGPKDDATNTSGQTTSNTSGGTSASSTPNDPRIVEPDLPTDPSEASSVLFESSHENPQATNPMTNDTAGDSRSIDFTSPVAEIASDDGSTVFDYNDGGMNGKSAVASSPTTMITSYGSPNGTVSVPNEGAKVFVFFYGGDIQKPVYFASTVDY